MGRFPWDSIGIPVTWTSLAITGGNGHHVEATVITAITGGNGHHEHHVSGILPGQRASVFRPSGQAIYLKNVGILIEIWNRFFLTLWWKVIFETWCSTTQKRQKLVTEMYHKSHSSPEHNGEVFDRSWLCFSPSQTCVNVPLVDYIMCAVTTKCAHFLFGKGIFDWNHALEHLRSHEHSV